MKFTRRIYSISELCYYTIYSNSTVSFLRNYHTIFHNVCLLLHHPGNAQGFQFPHIFSNICYFLLSFPPFLNFIIILLSEWYNILVLICISLIIIDVEHWLPRWCRICLPMQETQEMWAKSLGWEEPLE